MNPKIIRKCGDIRCGSNRNAMKLGSGCADVIPTIAVSFNQGIADVIPTIADVIPTLRSAIAHGITPLLLLRTKPPLLSK